MSQLQKKKQVTLDRFIYIDKESNGYSFLFSLSHFLLHYLPL